MGIVDGSPGQGTQPWEESNTKFAPREGGAGQIAISSTPFAGAIQTFIFIPGLRALPWATVLNSFQELKICP